MRTPRFSRRPHLRCDLREAETDAGHSRIEERLCRAADAGSLVERHPERGLGISLFVGFEESGG